MAKPIPDGYHAVTPYLTVRGAARAVADMFGKLTDPFGHQWGLATHTEDLTLEEIRRRGQAATGGAGGQGTGHA